MARASSSAMTVASTTISVSMSACVTGSTAGVPTGISAKIGAAAPILYPTPSRRRYVEVCTTTRHMIRCTRWRLVTIPYSPTTNSHAATRKGSMRRNSLAAWFILSPAFIICFAINQRLAEECNHQHHQSTRDLKPGEHADQEDCAAGQYVPGLAERDKVGEIVQSKRN